MIFLFPLLIILISLITLFPVFHVGLYGDDWLAIFRYVVHVSPPSKEGWNLFTYYLTPYGSQDIIMGLLYRAFGTNAFYYEITSYLFRMIAAFSLYPIVFYLTKNEKTPSSGSKLATFFAILFFSVTTIGFDSTGWLLTMSTYLTIAFFNLFMYFYVLFHETKKIKLLLISGVLFYLAYITASARMIGAPLFILSIEAFWLIRNRTINGLKNSGIRIGAIFTVLLIVSTTGHSLGNSSDWFERLSSGLTTMQKLISDGRSDFLLYPIVTIGGMIIPNFSLPSLQIDTKSDMLFSVFLPVLTLLFFFTFILKSNYSKLKMRDVYKSLIAGACWILFVFIIRKLNLITFSSSNLILMLTIGGLITIIWFLLALKYKAQKNLLTMLFLSFSVTLSSFFLTWVWAPGSYTDSTHRYLTLSAVGISMLFAVIISLGKEFKNQIYLTLLLSIFLVIHIVSTRTYIDKLLISHSQEIVDKVWSAIPNIPQVGKKPLVFYFEGDGTNGSVLSDSVTFGFPFHIALLYNLTESDKIPVPMGDLKEVVSAVKDGKSFKAYGYPLKPIPINQVYAFHLQGSDNLMNITDTVRQKLTND